MTVKCFILVFLFASFFSKAEYPSCPSEPDSDYKLNLNDLDVCILEHLNSYRDGDKEFDQDIFLKEAPKWLFEYSDLDSSGCLNINELKSLTLLFYDKDLREERLKEELDEIIDNIYEFGKADPQTLNSLKFQPYPDKDVFIAALSVKPEISNRLFCEQQEKICIDKSLASLIHVSKYLWSDKFNTWATKSKTTFDVNTGIQIVGHSVDVERKSIDEKYKKKIGLTRGVRIFENDESKWDKTLSIGNQFDDSFTQDFTAPAGLNFKKTASEETAESLSFAYRIDLSKKQNTFESWQYSLGHSIEKSTGKSESNDIRGYHYSQNKFFRRTGVDFEISFLDNYETGYEIWVGNLGFSPFVNNKGGCGVYKHSATWLNFGGENCNEIVFNQWKYYYIPIFGLETNQLKQRPRDPEASFIDDENFAYFKFQGGLKRGNVEFNYSNTRRYNISGGKHLSFQELNLDYYIDDLKRFSIGLSGKKGQRPIDIENIEVYELKFGFKL